MFVCVPVSVYLCVYRCLRLHMHVSVCVYNQKNKTIRKHCVTKPWFTVSCVAFPSALKSLRVFLNCDVSLCYNLGLLISTAIIQQCLISRQRECVVRRLITCLGATAAVTLQFVSFCTSTLHSSSPWQVFAVLRAATIFVPTLQHNYKRTATKILGVFPYVAGKLLCCCVVVATVVYQSRRSCPGMAEDRGIGSDLAPGCIFLHLNMGCWHRVLDLQHKGTEPEGIVTSVGE